MNPLNTSSLSMDAMLPNAQLQVAMTNAGNNDSRFAAILAQRENAAAGNAGREVGGESSSNVKVDPRLAQRQAEAKEAARSLVADVFIKPMLGAMAKDPFRGELFHGGQAEDMFQRQINEILADRIVERTDFSLVDRVYQQLMPASSAAAPTSATTNTLDLAG